MISTTALIATAIVGIISPRVAFIVLLVILLIN